MFPGHDGTVAHGRVRKDFKLAGYCTEPDPNMMLHRCLPGIDDIKVGKILGIAWHGDRRMG